MEQLRDSWLIVTPSLTQLRNLYRSKTYYAIHISLVSDVLLLPGLVFLPDEGHTVGVICGVPVHAVH